MSHDTNSERLLPGQQSPPHRSERHGEQHENSGPSGQADLEHERSTHQLEYSVMESDSPREIPTVSVGLASGGSGRESHDSDLQRGVEEENAKEMDKIFEEHWKSFYKKPPPKKKSLRVKLPEDVMSEDVAQMTSPPPGPEDLTHHPSLSVNPSEKSRRDKSKKSLGKVQKSLHPVPEKFLAEPVAGGGMVRPITSHPSAVSFKSPNNPSWYSDTQTDSVAAKSSYQNFSAWYIYNNIQQRECCVYIRDKNSESTKCQCGREEQWHREKGLDVDLNITTTKWSPEHHTETMSCDSFGEVLFAGFGAQSSRNAPYMRVDSTCDMEKVWKVLMDCWRLPVPKVLISVTGGAKHFSLRPRLKTILKQGLINAAVSTGAWIITGGTAAGVMQFVGEAVQDHVQASGNSDENPCVALGIASWGIVANNVALDGEGEKGQFPATYRMQDIYEETRRSAPLDHNHTHFLLVDDGTEGRYGVEIEFRSRLESYISQKVETGVTESQSVNVPHVLIVVEGGINTLKLVSESIECNTPVVVIDGSGRAADFIATAFRLTRNVNDEDCSVYPSDFVETMNAKARTMFEWKEGTSSEQIEKNVTEALDCLKVCLEERKLLNVFNLDKADSVQDIDRAILYALLKDKACSHYVHTVAASKSNAHSQLALALAWNRCDIARQEIFTAENRGKWQPVDLYNAMFTALVQDRADFVALFLDNGVDLKYFLTTRTLWNLYSNCIIDPTDAGASLLRYLITYSKQTMAAFLLCRGTPNFENFCDLLPYINKVIVHLLQDQRFNFYTEEEHLVMNESPTMTWKGDAEKIKPRSGRLQPLKSTEGLAARRRSRPKVKDVVDFEHPERELFIWAVLFNRRELTHLFWRTGKDHLGGALFASALLYRLSRLANSEEEAELSRDMASHSDNCEGWAVSILSECYKRDKQQTHRLLVRDLPHWGGVTLLSLADAFQQMEFAEHSACQTKLTSVWKGRMAMYTSHMKVFWCTFLPIFIPFIKFKVESKDSEEDKENFQELTASDDNKPSSSDAFRQPPNRVVPSGLPDTDKQEQEFVKSESRREKHILATNLKKVNVFDFTTDNVSIVLAIYYFYEAPVTKFFCGLLSYIMFMGLFSYVVLVKLAPIEEEDSPSVEEYVTWGWLSTLILEEIRQILVRDQCSLKYKFRNWCGNVWNYFDAIMHFLFLTSIVLRYSLTGENFVWARVFYSITLGLFSLRFMQYFYVERTMGPKIVMIRKMLQDLLFFFLILLVFVLSFGMAYHANLFPNSPPSWSILVNVLYFPYFQMYGELFVEHMTGEDVSGCTRNETIWRQDPFKRCPTENAVVSFLVAVYMIITNILLVNLLIAMFSYSFQAVHENSTQVWCYNRLSLVFEYLDRPALAPPVIIFSHIYRLLRLICHHITGRCRRYNCVHQYMTGAEQTCLTLFEKSATEQHLSLSKQKSTATLDSRVTSTVKSLKHVMTELEMIKESLQQPEVARTSPNLSRQYDLGNDIALLSRLQRERELMDMRPLPVQSAANRAESWPQHKSQDLEKLQKSVDSIVNQVSGMALHLSQLTRVVEASVAPQPVPLNNMMVTDMEVEGDEASA